jgi:glycosyltransferase involved in cell wall biosynthesis
MRVTIDLSPAVHRHAGLGRYAQELLAALITHSGGGAPQVAAGYQAFFYAPRGDEQLDGALARVPAYTVRMGAKPWRLSVLLAYLGNRAMDTRLPQADIFHATDHLLPLLKESRSVFTIHDLIFRFFPQYHLPLNRWYLTLMLPRFLRRADAIIAVSENTRRDVMRLMNIAAEKIIVIHEGVSPQFRRVTDPAERARVRSAYSLPEEYLLFFSTIEPRKNLTALFEAYARLLEMDSTLPPLVVAGRKGWMVQPILRRMGELGIRERVHLTDWVAEEDAPTVMSMAHVFVYPSLYEGFGLPPLEALAFFCDVLCSIV